MATTEQVQLKGPVEGRAAEVLTPQALDFVARLQREFGERRLELLSLRDERQKRLDAGEQPQFLVTTSTVRDSEWTVAKAPKDLQDRRVEITGPTDRKRLNIRSTSAWSASLSPDNRLRAAAKRPSAASLALSCASAGPAHITNATAETRARLRFIGASLGVQTKPCVLAG